MDCSPPDSSVHGIFQELFSARILSALGPRRSVGGGIGSAASTLRGTSGRMSLSKKEYSPQAIFHNENEKQRLNGSGTQFRKPATEVAPEARLWFQYPPAAVPPTGLCSRAHEPTRQEGAGAQGIRVSGPPRGQTALKLHVPAPVGTHVTLGPPAWRSPCPDGHSLVAGLFSKLAFCPSPSPHLLLLLCLLRPPVLSGDLSCPLRCLRSSASCFPGQLNQNPGGGFRH
ncbi:actin-associated protein FAM107A isoform X2 [Bubalus kerabau]|uniref:actin-associated protein FAM107A isoform X2 n=1 Tax=Bubalus carabanensis TaxID=3119969 RepID=UPI00244E7242|nr:actin-associated protein FAM107A isoform X2 [Bubalus carabanensis]